MTRETLGLVLFSLKKRGATIYISLSKRETATFLTCQLLKGIFLLAFQSHANLCHSQEMKLDFWKLRETPILQILSGSTIYLGLFKWGKENGAEKFFRGFRRWGLITFMKSQIGLFLRLQK